MLMKRKLGCLVVVLVLCVSGCGKDKIAETFEKEAPAMQIVNRIDNKDKTVGLLEVKAKNKNLEDLRKTLDNGKRLYYVMNGHIFFESNQDLINEYQYLVDNKQEITVDKIVNARDAIKSEDEFMLAMKLDGAIDIVAMKVKGDINYKLKNSVDEYNELADRYNNYIKNLYNNAPAYYRKKAAKSKKNTIELFPKYILKGDKISVEEAVPLESNDIKKSPVQIEIDKYICFDKYEFFTRDSKNGNKKELMVRTYWKINTPLNIEKVSFHIEILINNNKQFFTKDIDLDDSDKYRIVKERQELKFVALIGELEPEDAKKVLDVYKTATRANTYCTRIVFEDGKTLNR